MTIKNKKTSANKTFITYSLGEVILTGMKLFVCTDYYLKTK
jgi:hypothetical protein